MKKLKSTLPAMVISLGLVTIVAGLALSGVYSMTKGPIAEAELKAKTEAISEVLPDFDNDPLSEMKEIILSENDKYKVYPTTIDGKMVGAAVESHSLNGFSGLIVVVFGFDNNGKVINYQILQHAETPGLGEKMSHWFKENTGNRSVIGLDPSEKDLRVSKDGGDIDGITAATISSRAFLESLNNAYKALQTYLEQKS